jgi:TIR domain
MPGTRGLVRGRQLRRRPLRVFLSYRREDASGHAGRLYDLLAARYGHEHVFMDIDAIPLGSQFGETINRAVASCDVVIALIGRSWLSASAADGRRRLDDPDDFVRRELESALTEDVVLVPACVQGAEIPREQELPSSLAPLSGRQGFQLSDAGWRDDVERLIRRLEQVAHEPSEAGASADAPTRPGRVRTRTLVAAALAVGVIGAAAALALSSLGDDGSPSASEAPSASGASARRLLSLIPEITRADCDPASELEPGADASLACGVASTLTATYHLFPDRDAADDWFRRRRLEERVDPDAGTCKPSDFRGQTDYRIDGRTAGRYFCYVDGRLPSLFAVDHRVPVGLSAEVYHGGGRSAIDNLLLLWRQGDIPVQP